MWILGAAGANSVTGKWLWAVTLRLSLRFLICEMKESEQMMIYKVIILLKILWVYDCFYSPCSSCNSQFLMFILWKFQLLNLSLVVLNTVHQAEINSDFSCLKGFLSLTMFTHPSVDSLGGSSISLYRFWKSPIRPFLTELCSETLLVYIIQFYI